MNINDTYTPNWKLSAGAGGTANKASIEINITTTTTNYAHGAIGTPSLWQVFNSSGKSIDLGDQITADATNFIINSDEDINDVTINFIY